MTAPTLPGPETANGVLSLDAHQKVCQRGPDCPICPPRDDEKPARKRRRRKGARA